MIMSINLMYSTFGHIYKKFNDIGQQVTSDEWFFV